MKKTQVLDYINRKLGQTKLKTRNTTFASVSISGIRTAWWMNIKLENFKNEWNIVLAAEEELIWLKIPANTFKNPEQNFRIWESKNAVDLVISSDRNDRYLKDVSSGASGVDFRPFIKEKFSISEEMKSLWVNKSRTNHSLKPEVISNISNKETNPGIQKQRIITQNQTNITYEILYAEHLKGADTIMLQDPWIRLPYQFDNLLEFCVMLGNNNFEPGKTINLKIIAWNTKEFEGQSKDCFQELAESVREMRINLTFSLEKHHDRYIKANNGCKIILGRDLIFLKEEKAALILEM